ncbi:hypothetical protein JW707_02645 [Candidatus Woesearchaeota archaeon]|nr:hypothetical protein [Candidatus Woesearchaeota archaeon]
MVFWEEMLAGFADIFSAPFKSFDQLWVLIPLVIMWIVLAVYFARFKKEQLGWNTALANGITLGWLTLEGIRSLFEAKPGDFWLRFIANIAILGYAALIIYFSFTHKISSKWDFVLGSPHPVYFLGIFSVMWGYGTLEINLYVLLDLVILFAFILLLNKIFSHFVKSAEDEEENPPEMPSFGKEPPSQSFGGEKPELPPIGKPNQGFGDLPPIVKF